MVIALLNNDQIYASFSGFQGSAVPYAGYVDLPFSSNSVFVVGGDGRKTVLVCFVFVGRLCRCVHYPAVCFVLVVQQEFWPSY